MCKYLKTIKDAVEQYGNHKFNQEKNDFFKTMNLENRISYMVSHPTE